MQGPVRRARALELLGSVDVMIDERWAGIFLFIQNDFGLESKQYQLLEVYETL